MASVNLDAIDWADKCDECGANVGEDNLSCDEEGIAYCSKCEPDDPAVLADIGRTSGTSASSTDES